MVRTPSAARVMPDIAQDARPQAAGKLDWVGMAEIDVPVTLVDGEGVAWRTPAKVAAFVDLSRTEARGIHMSRLYLNVDRAFAAGPLTPASLRLALKEFLDSHRELSTRARLDVRFEYLVRRPALASANSGWKSYPVSLHAVMEGSQFHLELGVEIAYSSTCPCSAALARQLIQERFRQDFAAGNALDYETVVGWLGSEQGIAATPHSQRSIADVRVRLVPCFGSLPIIDIIDRVEAALQTVVQTAVKREDEQAFAALNGANLMFCEDAARRMQQALDVDERITDFWVRATHYESLHPHNAVAYASKGVPGGYSASSER